MHRVEGVVESTANHYDVAFAWETGAHYLQKQLDPMKGGPHAGPLAQGNYANIALHGDLSHLPLSGTCKVENPN